MKLTKPLAELVVQEPGIEGIYKQIERAGRVCYASEPKEGVTSKMFVDRLVNSGHGSVLEHGTVYLTIPNLMGHVDKASFYISHKYSDVIADRGDVRSSGNYYITTNYRVLVENNKLEDLQYLSEPSKHIKRYTFFVNCDIGITRECNRHRAFSVSEQSTRYCNFSKDKFLNEITFIKPCWLYEDNIDLAARQEFEKALYNAESSYMKLIDLGWKPQQAHKVLPLATASKIYYTAFENDWNHFLDLRCAPAAHPQAQEVANIIKDKLSEITNK